MRAISMFPDIVARHEQYVAEFYETFYDRTVPSKEVIRAIAVRAAREEIRTLAGRKSRENITPVFRMYGNQNVRVSIDGGQIVAIGHADTETLRSWLHATRASPKRYYPVTLVTEINGKPWSTRLVWLADSQGITQVARTAPGPRATWEKKVTPADIGPRKRYYENGSFANWINKPDLGYVEKKYGYPVSLRVKYEQDTPALRELRDKSDGRG
ncbi:hypothetical protein AZL_020570 [Azospirillum sp. B510]|uniref:hypothetical protein n=1 Tax=Azospirillum sp. (strain B510) TaxID=137722 RepID=UPI0001C4C2E6|nr:hypothetical protein [Azospirillum sp. B510]BAI71456.1 hypothetical protein AZL_008180 [Azospirillum sp. B510]BAI72695.1 hypothetical protein AZL_020570 [Azospirillum sp. B510]